MTFKQYILGCKITPDQRGDFVRLAKSDIHLPEVETWEEMRSYLDFLYQNHGLTEGGRHVWIEYHTGERRSRNA